MASFLQVRVGCVAVLCILLPHRAEFVSEGKHGSGHEGFDARDGVGYGRWRSG
jgi:hypothetical protein